ncbi:MAG: LysR family transcriptional regulator [Petrimonas sp.]|nr:LysR family transcriptional regulator [Petrimonas sp.]
MEPMDYRDTVFISVVENLSFSKAADELNISQPAVTSEHFHTPIHLGSTESIKNFLLDFDGVAIVSEKAVSGELQLKTLVKLKVSGFSIPRQFRIACKLGHKSRQVELFENFLLNYNI